jgi:putative ABC transport system permease protein
MNRRLESHKAAIRHLSWGPGNANLATQFVLPLALKLAFRNLLQDRLRFIATVIGIVFSIVLVTVQMGLFLSFERMVTAIIDHASADLWIVSKGVQCFEDPSNLDVRDRDGALSVPGVVSAIPVVIGFANWAKPSGGTTPVLVIGSNPNEPGLHPWNLIRGRAEALANPDSVAIDHTYFDRLGVHDVGDQTEIRDQKVEVVAVTSGIRSFTTTPYVFTSIPTAHIYTAVPPNRFSYLLVHLSPGTDMAAVRQQLLRRLPKVEILTTKEFSSRSRAFWLFGTGAGAAHCSASS